MWSNRELIINTEGKDRIVLSTQDFYNNLIKNEIENVDGCFLHDIKMDDCQWMCLRRDMSIRGKIQNTRRQT